MAPGGGHGPLPQATDLVTSAVTARSYVANVSTAPVDRSTWMSAYHPAPGDRSSGIAGLRVIVSAPVAWLVTLMLASVVVPALAPLRISSPPASVIGKIAALSASDLPNLAVT